MDDMKDKFKGFMKKMNTQLSSSSSSGKFKGQGRVLGAADGSSSSSRPVNPNPIQTRYSSQPSNSKPVQNNSSLNSKPLPQKVTTQPSTDQNKDKIVSVNGSASSRKTVDGFDPFDSLITTGKRSQNGYSLNVFECPICGRSFGSESEVSVHVETCVNDSTGNTDGSGDVASDLNAIVSTYLKSQPQGGSGEVVVRLFRNIVKEPENAKFRKIRMSNPKIREAVSEVAGGVELLEFVGFELKEQTGEMWAVMDVPDEVRVKLIGEAIELLEPRKVEQVAKVEDNKPSVASAGTEEPVERKKIDREIRVFFSVPESVAAKIELPDSFYNLSAEEIKREADARKKKLAESQLLIPKSYKEKQAQAARKKYKRTLVRVQFPDGVVLQGVFAPWEPTSALYEFVSTSLKDPSLEFELLDPVLVKRRVIPHSPNVGQRASTLEDEGLVPSALIKFRPRETEDNVFTGLRNELLEISEPLT